jgi:hypothetical protein
MGIVLLMVSTTDALMSQTDSKKGGRTYLEITLFYQLLVSNISSNPIWNSNLFT